MRNAVLGEQSLQSRGGFRGRQVVGVDTQVGDLRIQRRARLGQSLQHGGPVRPLQQRTAAIAREASQLFLDAGMQVHHAGAFAHQLPAVGIQHSTAAGRQQLAFAEQQIGQHLALAGAKPLFAFAVENGADAGAGALLNLTVGIDEAQAQTLGEPSPDRGFPGAHRTDQDQIAGGIHAQMLPRRLDCMALTGPGVGCPLRRRSPNHENRMSIAKIIELNAASKTSMEDAVRVGLKKCAETVTGIKGAWVNEIKVVTGEDGSVTEWRVNLRVSFIVD